MSHPSASLGVGPAAARASAQPQRRGGAAGLRRGLRGQCRAGTPAQSPPVRGGLAHDAHPGRAGRHRRVLPAAEARAAALAGGPGDRRLDGERPAAELRHHDDGPARRPHRARRRPCRAAGREGLPVGRRGARAASTASSTCSPVRSREALPLGRPFELIQSGIIFKPLPSGAPTHAAVHAALALHDKLGDRLHEVAGIVCLVHPWNFMTLREGVPADTLRARVSMRYLHCGGAALRRAGQLPVHRQALGDPLVQKFMTLIEIRQADDLPDNGLFPAAVRCGWRTARRPCALRHPAGRAGDADVRRPRPSRNTAAAPASCSTRRRSSARAQ